MPDLPQVDPGTFAGLILEPMRAGYGASVSGSVWLVIEYNHAWRGVGRAPVHTLQSCGRRQHSARCYRRNSMIPGELCTLCLPNYLKAGKPPCFVSPASNAINYIDLVPGISSVHITDACIMLNMIMPVSTFNTSVVTFVAIMVDDLSQPPRFGWHRKPCKVCWHSPLCMTVFILCITAQGFVAPYRRALAWMAYAGTAVC